jgi:hypothetical protein
MTFMNVLMLLSAHCLRTLSEVHERSALARRMTYASISFTIQNLRTLSRQQKQLHDWEASAAQILLECVTKTKGSGSAGIGTNA